MSKNNPRYEALFREALRIRLVEERIIDLYPSDFIQSPVHLSIGQEAVAVGVCAALQPQDWVFSTYRSHAFYLAKGGDMKSMFAELSGRIDGGAKGKAGSMHLTAPEVGFMGSSAVVGSTHPHAVGAAFAAKFKGEQRIQVVVFGDGATEQGVYHESLNLAALKKLPVLFLCENNGYAVHSKIVDRQSYGILDHARAYGIPVTHITAGHDFQAVLDGITPIVEAIRSQSGPHFVMIDTYRYKEHVGPGDDFNAGYRSADELKAWQAKDPLIVDTAMVERMSAEIAAEIDEAVAFAAASPFAGAEELLTDVDRPDAALTYVPASQLGAVPATMSYRDALMASMESALMKRDNSIILGQGVDDHKAIFGTTTDLPVRYGANRVFDTPIAEEGVTGFALGASLGGLYPITTHIRADFVLLATNQIVNLIAKYRYMFGGRFEVPMLIRTVVGRSWGQGAQHSQSLQSLFAHIPGLTVVMPSDPQSILETYPYLFEKYRGPVISFEHRLLYDLEFQVDADRLNRPQMPLGSRLDRRGKDITIVATSIMVLEARRAAKYLADHGIDCEIIDLHCVSHPDQSMIIDSVAKTGKLLVADTSWQAYGVSAEICRIVCEKGPHLLKAPVRTLGMAKAPCPTAKSLEDLYYPNLADLVDTVAAMVAGSPDHGIALPEEKSMADVYKRFKGPF